MIKNIIKVFFSNLLLTLVGLINSFIFPIILSINGYANYQEFLLYLSYSYLCHLGLASGMFMNYGGKEYHDIDKSQYKSEINLLLSILSIFTVAMLVIYSISDNHMILYISLSILPIGIFGAYKSLYQAWGKFTQYSVYNAIPSISISIIAIIFYIIFGYVEDNFLIIVYISIQYVVTVTLLLQFFKHTKGVYSSKLLSKKNMLTIKSGSVLLLGNYINMLFHAIDKQFINSFYSKYEFAMYSFAMSSQNTMFILITALSSPFYPKLAQKNMTKSQMNLLKEILLIVGSLSGCSYFIIAFIIRIFITKYIDCLKVVSILFAAFPAIAIINVIYINLYKVTKQLKKYIFTLIIMLIITAALDLMVVVVGGNFESIALATFFVYYIWLFYSKRHFDEIVFYKRDYIYLSLFLIGYSICIFSINSIMGLLLYTVWILIIDILCYKQSIKFILYNFIGFLMHKKFDLLVGDYDKTKNISQMDN